MLKQREQFNADFDNVIFGHLLINKHEKPEIG